MLNRPFLVALNGSHLSEKALPYAASIARATDRPLALLTLCGDLQRLSHSRGPGANNGDGECVRRSRHALAVAQRLAGQRVQVAEAAGNGHLLQQVLGCCHTQRPALFGMAPDCYSCHRRAWCASVAREVLRVARVPTLVVGPEVPDDDAKPVTLRQILVPLDGSRLSESALDVAATLAEGLEARLILVRAVRLPAYGFTHDAYDAYLPEIEQAMIAASEEYLTSVRAKVKTDRPAEIQVLRGLPAEAISELVIRANVDLVVMATHARRGLARWALGSVADRAVGGAAPVLLVRPDGATALS